MKEKKAVWGRAQPTRAAVEKESWPAAGSPVAGSTESEPLARGRREGGRLIVKPRWRSHRQIVQNAGLEGSVIVAKVKARREQPRV